MADLDDLARGLAQRLLDFPDRVQHVPAVRAGGSNGCMAMNRAAPTGLRVMEVVADMRSEGATVADIAAETFLTGWNVREALAQLIRLGYVEQVAGRQPARWRLEPNGTATTDASQLQAAGYTQGRGVS
jgi:hypothetical protein